MRRVIGLVLTAGLLTLPATASSGRTARSAAAEKTGSIELVGHEPLMNRGMNAALAVHGNYAYIGSRTDAKGPDNLTHAGVMVVDVSDPGAPVIASEIGPPNEGQEGETSRELRVWHEQELLIVMNLGSNCSYLIHACSPRGVDDNFRFYDISGKNAAEPKLISEYVPSEPAHEFFLWDDPKKKGRALLFTSTPSGSQELLVTDISRARDEKFVELGKASFGQQDSLHSLAVSNDGTRGYLSHLLGGVMVIDTSQYVRGAAKPEPRIITPPMNSAKWAGPGVHSAVKLYGRDFLLTTDEAYGDALKALGEHGCPWGWSRMLDISDPVKPKVIAEYKIAQNDPSYCTTDAPRPSSSYASHNPTLTKNLAFISWHAGGLQVVDTTDPAKPTQVAEWKPEPLLYAITEDPALSAGQDKVVVWSYPIIQDGLIYVTDVRNGLYILKYKGPFEDEVSSIGFIEGNSNQGDALKFEPVKR